MTNNKEPLIIDGSATKEDDGAGGGEREWAEVVDPPAHAKRVF